MREVNIGSTHSTGSADFHGKFCSPYTIQWVFDTHALAVGTAQEVVKRGGDTWFFITDDYAFGHSLERDAAEVVTANGGKVDRTPVAFVTLPSWPGARKQPLPCSTSAGKTFSPPVLIISSMRPWRWR